MKDFDPVFFLLIIATGGAVEMISRSVLLGMLTCAFIGAFYTRKTI